MPTHPVDTAPEGTPSAGRARGRWARALGPLQHLLAERPGRRRVSARRFTEALTTPVTELVCRPAYSRPALCDALDCDPPGSSVHGNLQARTLEWAAIPFSRGSFQPRDGTWVSCTAGGFLPSEPPEKPRRPHHLSLILRLNRPSGCSAHQQPPLGSSSYHLHPLKDPRINTQLDHSQMEASGRRLWGRGASRRRYLGARLCPAGCAWVVEKALSARVGGAAWAAETGEPFVPQHPAARSEGPANDGLV